MGKPTQIILDGEALPYTGRDKYACYEGDLSKLLTMQAGNMVREVPSKSKVWMVRYSYDYMGNEQCRRVLAILRRTGAISAAVLPDNSDQMITSQFFVTQLTNPTFAFAKNGVGLWHNLSFTLREVRPHA